MFLNLYGNNPDLFIMQLPNVGRESHSWLHHMTRKDVTFGHVNIFVQGTPEVSLSTLENDLKGIKGYNTFRFMMTRKIKKSAHAIHFVFNMIYKNRMSK